MSFELAPTIQVKNLAIDSRFLNRKVQVDIYHPSGSFEPARTDLLLINDGQDLRTMDFSTILEELVQLKEISPLVCVGIHAGAQRKMEYGVAGEPDFRGRGALAIDYTSFVFQELLPWLKMQFSTFEFRSQSFAGFSLGGLTAFDIVYSHPHYFSYAAVFSGSLWWRSVDQEDPSYDDQQHRIIHQRVRKGNYHPGLRFFFQCGNKDEVQDRNKNGIIDSIDDTLDLVKELVNKGYSPADDIYYLEIEDGSHDVPSWARAFPSFLKWEFEWRG